MARPVKKAPEQWEQEILNAAQKLFISKGYEETSITDIMELVGGATGMFYRCFQSKEEILNVLVEKWVELYMQKITFLLGNPQGTLSEKFTAILRTIEEMSKRTIGMENFFSASNEIVLNKLTKQMTSAFTPLLADFLESWVREGVLAIGNVEFYANYIIYGALGALNSGMDFIGENITRNIQFLPQIIANTLQVDVNVLLNACDRKDNE